MNVITIKKPQRFEKLDSTAAENYFRLREGGISFLENEVIKPFEAALKEKTGFSDENIPDIAATKKLNLDGIVFSITSEPTTKRPSYGEIYEKLTTYLNIINEEYDQGTRKEGVITIDSLPYISAENILTKILEWKDEVLDRGVKQTIKFKLPEEIEDENLKSLAVGLVDYSAINPATARTYVRAKIMKLDAAEIISDFEGKLKDQTGFSKENLPENTENSWVQAGDYLFKIQSVPYPSTSYGKIINDLAKSSDNLKSAGDLCLMLDGKEALLENIYEIRTRDDSKYISLRSLQSRISKLTEKNTENTLGQKITFYLIA
jgi:hypothetical protein